MVVAVDGPSSSEVTGATIRTDAGELVVLQVGTLDLSNGGLPAAHLREHLMSGEPITATASNDVMTRYVDAQ